MAQPEYTGTKLLTSTKEAIGSLIELKDKAPNMIELMEDLMTAGIIEGRKKQLGSLLKADEEATIKRTNNRALCKYDENMILIMKEITEVGANQETIQKINAMME